MKKILSLLADDKVIKITDSDEDGIFNNFFSIDSITLVLGKNGSGKTHLLNSICHLISQPEVKYGIFYEDEDGILIEGIDRRTMKGLGGIYFTPLPYQRPIARSSRTINSSSKKNNNQKSMEQYKEISKFLKLDLKLTAKLEIKNFIVNYNLTQAIIELDDYILKYTNNNELLETIRDYKLDNEINHQNDSRLIFEPDESTSEETHNTAKSDRAIEYKIKARSRITTRIRNIIDSHLYLNDPYNSPFIIQAYNKLTQGKSDKDSYTIALLDLIGVINKPLNRKEQRNQEYIKKMADNTAIICAHFEITSSTHNEEVEIDAECIYRVFGPETIDNSCFDIGWSKLSSGMQALIDQFSNLQQALASHRNRNIENIILLVDEGDAFLHAEWQGRYIELLDKFLYHSKKSLGFKSIQAIIATHSAILTSDIPSDFIINLNNEELGKTFASSLDKITFNSLDASPIGSFATKKIKEIHKRIISNTFTKSDIKIISQIGDSMIRIPLEVELEKRGPRNGD